jgi:hypothetical protein
MGGAGDTALPQLGVEVFPQQRVSVEGVTNDQ